MKLHVLTVGTHNSNWLAVNPKLNSFSKTISSSTVYITRVVLPPTNRSLVIGAFGECNLSRKHLSSLVVRGLDDR